MHYLELELIWYRWKVVCSINRPWNKTWTGFIQIRNETHNHSNITLKAIEIIVIYGSIVQNSQ